MALLDAPAYDEAREKRRRNTIIIIVVGILIVATLAWHFRHFRQEREVSSFFTALEQKDYPKAYGIYYNDSQWQQHQEKYNDYPLNDFERDWGPSGDFGYITSHKIAGSETGKSPSNGVIVFVRVNNRPEATRIFVDDEKHTLTLWPF
jgi:hypothetical protein